MSLVDAIRLLELGTKIARGDMPTASEVTDAIAPLVDLIPIDELAKFLDESRRRRADAVADAAERMKVG